MGVGGRGPPPWGWFGLVCVLFCVWFLRFVVLLFVLFIVCSFSFLFVVLLLRRVACLGLVSSSLLRVG